MQKNNLILLLFSAITLALFSACSKEPGKKPAASTEPVLYIHFPATYLAYTQVDSALLQWTEAGNIHQLKLLQRNDSLLLPLKDLPAGQHSYEITLFAQKRYANQYQGTWTLQKTLTLPANQSLVVTAPASFEDAAWKPRVHLKDAIGHEALLALRPDDAYFFIYPAPRTTTSYTVERTYWNTKGGVNTVASKTWQCNSNCTGNANETYFTDFIQRIGTRLWNHISLVVFFETDINTGGGWLLTLEFEP